MESKCIVCGTEYVRNAPHQLCCSKACRGKKWKLTNRADYLASQSKHNKKIVENKREERLKVKKNCEQCGQEFGGGRNISFQKYCSWKCRNAKYEQLNPEKIKEYAKKERENNKDRIKSTDARGHDRRMFDGLRVKTLERDGNECVTCSSKDLLVVHHIDHDKKNNDPENLQTLCRACHARHHKLCPAHNA